MLITLLIVIFISFIGVGLPDSVFGTAWPAIYRDFGLPISMAGYISSAVSIGTIISSLLSAKLINRFGTGLVTAFSTLLTTVALFGYAITQHHAFFFLFAIPLGLGAGAIDTALNNFVAIHYSASQLSFLHCSYGLGVAASPFLMSLALGESNNWRYGYFMVALIQLGITIVSFVALPLWFKIEKRTKEENDTPQRTLTIPQLIKTPGVMWSCFSFFGSCALELTAGSWCSSYFVNTKAVSTDKAALITMLFYVGLTLGRLLSGIFANMLGSKKILVISIAGILPTALLIFLLPLPTPLTAAALFLLGLGIGPVYPNLVHLTPKNFGFDISQSVMGLQQAMTYVGILIMPWLFGVLAGIFTTALLPYYLIAMFAIYVAAFIALMRSVKKHKK